MKQSTLSEKYIPRNNTRNREFRKINFGKLFKTFFNHSGVRFLSKPNLKDKFVCIRPESKSVK